jgi:hypothetical protein
MCYTKVGSCMPTLSQPKKAKSNDHSTQTSFLPYLQSNLKTLAMDKHSSLISRNLNDKGRLRAIYIPLK